VRTFNYPPARIDDVVENIHGVQVADPYRWLENQNGPDTRAWIDRENELTRSVLDGLPGREEIRRRLTELQRVDNVGLPIARSEWTFFTKRRADQDLACIYRREGIAGEDELLIDPHPLSADLTTSVLLLDVSEDGGLLVYGVRDGGADEFAIHLFDVARRADLPDVLPRGRYLNAAVAPDGSRLYYSWHDDNGPRARVHQIGTEPSADEELFGAGLGKEKLLVVELAANGRWLVITVYYGSAGPKTDVYYQDVLTGTPPAPIVDDVEARFFPTVADNQLFVRTNWDAPNGRVLAVDLERPARENWHEIVPASESVLTDVTAAGGRLVVTSLRDVVSELRVYEPDGTLTRELSFPTLGSVGGVSGQWERPEVYFSYTSFHLPTTIYRHDLATGEQTVWARPNVPIAPEHFRLSQAWFASRDGTKVPMFLLHQAGLALDGARPTLLTGYGGFNLSYTPVFSPASVLWSERGGVFAVANLRGGGEFGEAWHQTGMLERKQNVFDDFIGAAECLVARGYTRPDRLAISGGSNGGLLVGAALTQRPDLFGAVVCSYPLLDMLRYQQFLVARFWVPEYGSAENAEQFTYLYAYSPYHQVKPGVDYPAVLFVTGDLDTRVDPLHARKMAALLQASTGSDRPVLLIYHTRAGHIGGLPLTQVIANQTDEHSFLFWQLGA
jgi:prolyl oligopeptidase